MPQTVRVHRHGVKEEGDSQKIYFMLIFSQISLFLSKFSSQSNSESLFFVQIWVNSPHNASGYYTIYGEESLQADHFNTRLSFGEPQTLWARTSYLGFIKRTELLDASGGERTFDKRCLVTL